MNKFVSSILELNSPNSKKSSSLHTNFSSLNKNFCSNSKVEQKFLLNSRIESYRVLRHARNPTLRSRYASIHSKKSLFDSHLKNSTCDQSIRTNRSRRQKASQIVWSAEKDREFFNDTDSHREDWFYKFSLSPQDSRRRVDLLSLRLRQSNNQHVIMFCSLMNNRNLLFKDVDINDYHAIMHSSKKLKTIVKWLLQHDLLQQFSLIIELLYEL